MAQASARVRYKKPPQVEVEWVDAADHEFAGSLDEAQLSGTLIRRLQLGYLVFQGRNTHDDEVLVLAQTIDPPDAPGETLKVDRLTVIPVTWVRKIVYKGRKKKGARGGARDEQLDARETTAVGEQRRDA